MNNLRSSVTSLKLNHQRNAGFINLVIYPTDKRTTLNIDLEYEHLWCSLFDMKTYTQHFAHRVLSWGRPTVTGTQQIHELAYPVSTLCGSFFGDFIIEIHNMIERKKRVTSLDSIIPNNGNIKAGSKAETASGRASVSQKMATTNNVYAHSAS